MRLGYQKDFLAPYTINLPAPGLALSGDVLQPETQPEGESVVAYIHYSLIMSKSTKQALYSAANVDNQQQQSITGSKGRKWFVDQRIGAEHQITQQAYRHSPWDRGHLTRRTAVTWGDHPTALAASNDSCAYSNASMQHKHFNEDEWRLPETAVSKFSLAKADKLTVMTGPIFTVCDRFYSQGLTMAPVRIPSGFWKTMTYVNDQNQLVTAAYIMFQDTDTLKTVKAKSRIQLRHFRVTTTELQLWTGLEFDHQMFDSNPLQFYSGPEVIKIKQFKQLTNSTQALLAAGVANSAAIKEARDKMELQQLYDLIDELSWY